jgi:hypothetical protein
MLKLVYLQRLDFKKRYFGNVDFETFSTCLWPFNNMFAFLFITIMLNVLGQINVSSAWV